jgi:diguanylate cyclase (GGDEF)-like protein
VEHRQPGWVRAGFAIGVVLLLGQAASCLPGIRDQLGDDWIGDQVLQDILYPLAAVLVLARSGGGHRDRRAWIVLGCGLLSYAVGNAYFIALDDYLVPGAWNLGDPFMLALYPCLYVTVVLLLRRRLPGLTTSAWLDGFIAAGSGAAFAWLVFHGAAAAGHGQPLHVVIANLAYPVADVVLAGCLLGAWALTGWRTERVWLMLVVGMAVFAVADALLLLNTLRDTDLIGHWLDTIWLLGIAAMVAAAWVPPPRARRPGHGTQAWVAGGVPALLSCACLGLLLYGSVRAEALPWFSSVVSAAAVGCAVLRMLLTVRSVEALADARKQARTDDLTELPNRRLFLERVDGELDDRAHDRPLAVVIIDLDRFKEVNDSFGHHVGDRLLQLVAERLANARTGPDVLLARLGGDEFGVLMPKADADRARQFAAGVIVALQQPFVLDDAGLHVDASIGVAMFPVDGTDRATLLRHADTAMYQAKSTHSGFALAVGQVDDDATRRALDTLEQLRDGLGRGELILHYQPQFHVHSGQAVGVEALVRWEHPIRGLLYPDGFLPIAERAGLMGRITLQVLEIALRQSREWRSMGVDITVAVNLSASNLQDEALPDRVADALFRYGVPAASLHLEVTESIIMQDAERAKNLLIQLRELGIHLAVDDYGTGYSSLAYLQTLPVDDLKLDRAFVAHCDTDSRSAAIVASTVDLAHNLGLRMIAEGVENEVVMDRLRHFGCDVAQGYFLSRPQNPESLTPWLVRHRQSPNVYVHPQAF